MLRQKQISFSYSNVELFPVSALNRLFETNLLEKQTIWFYPIFRKIQNQLKRIQKQPIERRLRSNTNQIKSCLNLLWGR